MSEQTIPPIRPVPPVEKLVSEAPEIIPPKDNLPENSSEVGQGSSSAVSENPGLSSESITTFQGINYASFILTFCLAGFASIVVFRKAMNVSVKRFSIGAKTLSLAYLIIAFNSFFGTYLYSKFLNGDSTSLPLTIPILSWLFVGPAVAVVLNSILTRDDVPSVTKIIFDAFTYLVIFGCVVASQIPSLGEKEPLVLSFFGAIFFIVPIIRFSVSLKAAKASHPELQEMFVQILIRSLLILPILLPSLVFANVYELSSDELTMLLFNLVTFVFVLMSGLLMVISIDYITQGFSAEQLVTSKGVTPTPATNTARNPNVPQIQPDTPVASTPSTVQEKQKPSAKKTTKLKIPSTQATPPPTEKSPERSSASFKESPEIANFDVEQEDSTVIEFHPSQSSVDESRTDSSDNLKSKRSKIGSSDLKPDPKKNVKAPQLPKAPSSPDEPKTSNSKPSVKPPEKPKKRF